MADNNPPIETVEASEQADQLGRLYDCGHCGCNLTTTAVEDEGAEGIPSDLLFCENCDCVADQSTAIFRPERALLYLRNLERGPYKYVEKRALLSVFWTRFAEENR